MYDYLIVGAGLFGAVFAHEATAAGKRCLVIDKRSHIAGNIYTEDVEGIAVHRYGAHIIHTNNKAVWDYVNRFATFNRYTNSPVANYKGELYNLPFNMNTFNKMWGVVTPAEAQAKIDEQRAAHYTAHPQNLEEQAINLVGVDIYEKLIKGYTEKRGAAPARRCRRSSSSACPCAWTFDNNYFNALYQGIPNEGYTALVATCWTASRSASIPTTWPTAPRWTPWQAKSSTPGPSTPTLTPATARCNTAASGLRPRCWTAPTTRATPSSTTRMPRPPTPASSSTSILCSAPPSPAPKRSSAANIRPSGNPATSRITPSRRRERRAVRPLQSVGRRPAGRHLRRPPGRVQVLRHGPRHRGRAGLRTAGTERLTKMAGLTLRAAP